MQTQWQTDSWEPKQTFRPQVLSQSKKSNSNTWQPKNMRQALIRASSQHMGLVLLNPQNSDKYTSVVYKLHSPWHSVTAVEEEYNTPCNTPYTIISSLIREVTSVLSLLFLTSIYAFWFSYTHYFHTDTYFIRTGSVSHIHYIYTYLCVHRYVYVCIYLYIKTFTIFSTLCFELYPLLQSVCFACCLLFHSTVFISLFFSLLDQIVLWLSWYINILVHV